jgi:hypothetical protein
LKLAQRGDGARPSGPFNVQQSEALRYSSPLGVFELKRRERRAPSRFAPRHSISRVSVERTMFFFIVFAARLGQHPLTSIL